MDINEDLEQIRSLDGEGLSAWLDDRAPDVTSAQWWWGILETLESRVNGLRGLTAVERRELLGCAARLLAVGAEQDRLARTLVAYWQLRLAVTAARGEQTASGLPETVTAEGAVRWALANMPVSREEIINHARARAARYRQEGDGFFAPVGVDSHSLEGINDAHLTLLRNVERVLSALAWIEPSRLDEDIRAELESWLSILPHLSVG